MNICPKCGKENELNAGFCIGCGIPLEKNGGQSSDVMKLSSNTPINKAFYMSAIISTLTLFALIVCFAP